MSERKQARRLGFAFLAFLVAVVVFQIIFTVLFARFLPEVMQKPWYPFLISALPNYVVGMPLFYFLTRNIPDTPRVRGERFTLGTVLRYAVIGIAISYLFALLGDLLNAPFVEIYGVDENMLEDLILNADLPSTILFVVLLAPLLEELVFRKRYLTKALQFGKTRAVVAGGIAFGLFHLNIPQFVYATALGIFWGMVYVRHRSYALVVVLHMITNAIGSLLMPWLAFQVTGGETIGGAFILVMMAIGVVLLFLERRGFYAAMRDEPEEEGKRRPALILNIGFLSYVIFTVGAFLLAALGTQMLS